jgi:lipopolysaccharide assembly outer membrane protein LptD (OstA)
LRRLLAGWLGLVAFAVAPAFADDPGDVGSVRILQPGAPVELSADSMEYEAARDLYVARGSVLIRQAGRELRAEWMAFNNRTRRGIASGNVIYTDGTDTVHTSFVEFDVETLEGVMFDAEFDVANNRLELRGAEIAKTGERTYSFKEGEFTACRCPDPEARKPWKLTAEKADLEVEGYGTARNTTLEVLGVPVVWLPWMIYPLKTERQSGLLFPDFALSGRNGVEVGLPIFWAVADPVNLVFTPRWLQKRGFKADLESQYVFGERSGGDLFGSFIHDTKVKEDTRETPFGKNRWATRGVHDIHLPLGWRFQTDYAFASDNSHANDFDDLRRHRADRFLPSQGFVGRPFGPSGGFGLEAGARFRDDIMNPDDTDRDDFVLQRLPEASAQALPASLPFASWIAPTLGVDYAWFQQGDRPPSVYGRPDLLETGNGRFLDTGIDGLPTESGVPLSGNFVEQGRDGQGGASSPDPNRDDFDQVTNPTGTEGDGLFQEGELLADDGHRMRFTPRLGLPFRLLDAVEFYPEVGWHETLYQSDAQGLERRGFLTGRVDLRTRLRGRFGDVSHLLEPRVGWAYLGKTSQSGNPVFVPATAVPQRRLRELDLDNLTLDSADRVEAVNVVTLGLENRIHGGAEAGGGARLLADFVLSALYDIRNTEFGNIYLDGRAYPLRGSTLRFNVGFDPGKARLTEALTQLLWRDRRGDVVSLGYRYLRDVPRFFEAFPVQNDRFDNFKSETENINQIDGGVRIAITREWAVSYRGAYSFDQSELLANAGGIEFFSRCRCWAVRLELRASRSRGASVSLQYTLLGLGDDSRNPFGSGGRQVGASFLDAF